MADKMHHAGRKPPGLVRRRHLQGALLGGLALVASGLIWTSLSRGVRKQQETTSWVLHAQEVLLRSADLELHLFAAISEARGYRINGDPAEIARVNEASRQVANDLDILRALAADSPRQMAELARLRPLIVERLGVLRSNAGIASGREAQDYPRKTPLETTALMDQVTSGIKRLEAEETRLLATRRESLGQARQSASFGVAAGGAALTASVLLALALARGRQGAMRRARRLERRVAAQMVALRQSEDRERRLFAGTPALLQSVDAEGCVVAVSDAWLRCFGYAGGEVIGRAAANFLTPPARRVWRSEIMTMLLRDGLCTQAECQIMCKDGDTRDVLVTATLTRDQQGNPRQIDAVLENVTPRRRAERALAQERQRLASLIAVTDVGTWEWNVPTGELLVNERYAAMFGWTRAEMEAFSIEDAFLLIHPEEQAGSRETVRRLAEGELHSYEHERRMRHRDGHYIWVVSRAEVVSRLADGRPAWMFGALKDISDRKAQEAALRRSEANSRLILDNATDLIARVGPDGRPIYVSSATERIFGVPPEMFMARDFSEFIHPDDLPELMAAKHGLLAGSLAEINILFRVLHPLRGELCLEYGARAVPDEATGVPAGYISVTRDVTERVRMEAEREERARERLVSAELDRVARQMAEARLTAEKANRAKTRFLAGMSHELRTPLNGILGYAQLLRMDGGLSATQSERLDCMLAAGSHLLEMVSCVLDLSEIENETIDIQTVPVDVVGVVEASINIVRPAASAKGLATRLSVAPDTPRRLMSDPARLRQVLLNLLGNAVKYTPSGSVELRLACIGAARLRFEVADTGPGIAPAKVHLLFEEFERIDAGVSGNVEGAGLGLSLARRLASMLGGNLGYADNPGGGSVFWLELPVSRGDVQVAAPASASDFSAPSARVAHDAAPGRQVLVVDDVAMNRDIAEAFIRSAGYEVTCAQSGDEAVGLAARADYHVILMDIRMPGMDGLEATRRIRALPGPRALVPIVAFTAQVFTEQIEACRAAGMDTHLAKPFTLDTLAGAISRGVAAREQRAAAYA
jgi:PAS domain S-box-containing protein